MKRLLPFLVFSCFALSIRPLAGEAVFTPLAQDAIVPAGSKLETLYDEGAFTEGPAAAPDGSVYFSDIGHRLLRWNPEDGKVSVIRDPNGKTNGLMFDAKGRLVACEGANDGGRRISRMERDGTVKTVADSYRGKRFNSPNDLAIRPDGAIYFTDPRYVGEEPRELDFQGVFMIDAGGEVSLASKKAKKPNGILFSKNGKVAYVADHQVEDGGTRSLLAFRVKKDGAFGGSRVVHDFSPGRGVDGMALDAKGNVYATAGRGEKGGVYVFSPSGGHLAFISTPGSPTNCAFGRGKEAKTLYVTAGTKGADGRGKPYGLYRIRLAVPGHHAVSFE